MKHKTKEGKIVSFYLSNHVLAKINKICFELNRNKSQVVEDAISDVYSRLEEKKAEQELNKLLINNNGGNNSNNYLIT